MPGLVIDESKRGPLLGRFVFAFSELGVGQDFFVEGQNLIAAFHQAAKGRERTLGRKFKVRRHWRDGRVGVRVERVV